MLVANSIVWVSVVLYRLLLLAYPAAFRREYGALMLQAFRQMCWDALRRRRYWGLWDVWSCVLPDWVVSVLEQRSSARVYRPQFGVFTRMRGWFAGWRPLRGLPWLFSLLLLTIAIVVFGMRYFAG